ncbi:MAG: Gp138 family membrane-puncturing spike protein [Burkholderiaceae bacterium]
MAEASGDFLASMRALIKSEMIDLNTSLDGVVVDYADGFATVKPVGKKRFADGDALDFPNITKVPIRWPVFAGGVAGVRGPIKAGDKCVLIFHQQANDGSDDMRRFDLSDAYAVMVDNAQAAQGANNADMVMYFGDAYIKLTEAGALEINAPGGTKTISPNNEFTGNNLVQGSETVNAGMSVQGGSSGATMTINGNIASTGTITNNGKSVGSNHTHPGDSGGTTGTPN